MSVVDASVWVSVFLRQDAHHRATRRWLADRLASGEAIVSPVLLLSEVGGAIARQTRSPGTADEALKIIERIPGLRIVPVDHRLGRAAADLAVMLRLRGADAVYVAVAAHLKVPLVTLDAEQRERAKSLIEVRTPDAARRAGASRRGE
jgi:predicted nucleic acid-binding protein